MTTVKEKAYAKVNLYLNVVSRRDDGFHNIKTIMHSVSLCDDVTVSVSAAHKNLISMFVSGSGFLPTDSRNLAYKAAELFLERIGKSASVHIKLEKRIPISAGLAGGSSDAAAVLRALNKIYKRPFTMAALANLGLELGSDVPYCVMGKTAICSGRGEIMMPLNADSNLNFVIATANEKTSTPEAYKALDDMFSSFDGTVPFEEEKCFVETSNALVSAKIPENTFNVFEKVVLQNCPGATDIKEKMYELGAATAMMSGSGPAVFGIFKSRDDAFLASEALKKIGYCAYQADSV